MITCEKANVHEFFNEGARDVALCCIYKALYVYLIVPNNMTAVRQHVSARARG